MKRPVAMEKHIENGKSIIDIAYTEELTAEHETKMENIFNDYRLK